MCALYRFPDGDKESDGPSESGDNTSESTQGNSEAGAGCAQERGKGLINLVAIYVCFASRISLIFRFVT